MANAVLIGYVIIAMAEDQSDGPGEKTPEEKAAAAAAAAARQEGKKDR